MVEVRRQAHCPHRGLLDCLFDRYDASASIVTIVMLDSRISLERNGCRAGAELRGREGG